MHGQFVRGKSDVPSKTKWFWKNLDPETTILEWTRSIRPEGFRWHDLDQALVAPKLSKLSAEMQKAFFKDEAEISFEGRRRGNSAYFLQTFLDKQIERTDEWARRKYEIYCECWYERWPADCSLKHDSSIKNNDSLTESERHKTGERKSVPSQFWLLNVSN